MGVCSSHRLAATPPLNTAAPDIDVLALLVQHTNDSLPLYRLHGAFSCKVVDVYDGDTVTIVLYNKGAFEKHKLRMYGYDSPEIKPRLDVVDRAAIIVRARAAQAFLAARVMDKICEFRSMGFDKYGRLLGTLHDLEGNLSEYMLAAGHGVVYTGGTKAPAIRPPSPP